MKGNPSLETATVARVVSDEAQLEVARQNANTKIPITKRESAEARYCTNVRERQELGLSTAF